MGLIKGGLIDAHVRQETLKSCQLNFANRGGEG